MNVAACSRAPYAQSINACACSNSPACAARSVRAPVHAHQHAPHIFCDLCARGMRASRLRAHNDIAPRCAARSKHLAPSYQCSAIARIAACGCLRAIRHRKQHIAQRGTAVIIGDSRLRAENRCNLKPMLLMAYRHGKSRIKHARAAAAACYQQQRAGGIKMAK